MILRILSRALPTFLMSLAACGSDDSVDAPGALDASVADGAHADSSTPQNDGGQGFDAMIPTDGGLPGPLVQSKNPNYFQDATGHAIVLAGSHTWNDFQDWGASGALQPLDFTAYTKF